MHTQGLESISDHELLRKAVRERWPISPAVRNKILKILENRLDFPEDPNFIKTLQIYMQMDKINVLHERNHTPQVHLHAEITPELIEVRRKELELQKAYLIIQEPKEFDADPAYNCSLEIVYIQEKSDE